MKEPGAARRRGTPEMLLPFPEEVAGVAGDRACSGVPPWHWRARFLYRGADTVRSGIRAAPGILAFPHPLRSIAVPNSISLRPVSPVNPLNDEQRKAAAALLRRAAPAAADLGLLFTRQGYELALVGGSVRDVFLGGSRETWT